MRCEECKHYWYDADTDAYGCNKEDEITDEIMKGNKECPFFQYRDDIEESD